jgi:DNA polymerase (family X)
LAKQRIEIEGVQRELGDTIRILQGAEVEIRADGSLDYPDDILASLDIVIASLHVSLRQPREIVTQRMVNAIKNPHVDIIAHPSGRLLPNREGADLDYDAVLSTRRASMALHSKSTPAPTGWIWMRCTCAGQPRWASRWRSIPMRMPPITWI